MTYVLRRKLVFWRNKNCTLLISWTNTWIVEILMSLEMLSFCILIVIFVKPTFSMMTSSDVILMCNISHVMSVDLSINTVTTKDMIISKHITKCPIISVWKKIVLIKNSLPSKLPINSKYIECKFMKNKIKKLISNNYVDSNMKGKVQMMKLLSSKTNKVSIWRVSSSHWKKVKIEFLLKLINNKINISISGTFIIANLMKMSMLKKFFLKRLWPNKLKSKRVNQNNNKRLQVKKRRKSTYRNNKFKSKKSKNLPLFQYKINNFYLKTFYLFNLSNGQNLQMINLTLN